MAFKLKNGSELRDQLQESGRFAVTVEQTRALFLELFGDLVMSDRSLIVPGNPEASLRAIVDAIRGAEAMPDDPKPEPAAVVAPGP